MMQEPDYRHKKEKTPNGIFSFYWVAEGTRTLDIQNHNLTL